MRGSWFKHIPFEGDPARRWLAVPVILLANALAVLVIHPLVGRPAFGVPAFVLASIAGAVAGVRAGVVTALAMQALNFVFAQILQDPSTDPLILAAVAFGVSALMALATGGLRALLQRIARVNRLLDEQVRVRRAAEASLRESLSLHRSLVSTLGEGVGLFDASDRFVFANAAAEKLLGVSGGQLVGRPFEDFVTEESAGELRRRRELPREEASSYELQLGDQESRVVLVTETRMAAGGLAGGRTLRVMRDVTERARLERERAELQQYLQRTEALRSLAVMAGGVAHDFNNLLSGVIGSTELGLLKLGKSPALVRSCLEEARKFATEASELSRKMLAYAGKRNTSLEPVSLADEVEAALRLVSALVTKKAALVNRIPASLPALLADPTGLHQVVTNLMLNAAEAIADGVRGTITLDGALEEVSGSQSGRVCSGASPGPGKYVVMSVSDTGGGMSRETRSRLFEPFFSTKFQGRGMGLAATLGIVRSQGGGITVESKPGVGTTFRVYWPVAEASHRVEVASTCTASVELRGITVLLVDDEPAVRDVSAPLLEELGCAVHRAASGREALALFEREHARIDLILLDLTMPELSGLEVLTALRRIDPKARVVLTSGYGIESTGGAFPPPDAVGFVPKPHSLANLGSAMRIALETGRPSAVAPGDGAPSDAGDAEPLPLSGPHAPAP